MWPLVIMKALDGWYKDSWPWKTCVGM